MAIIEYGSLDGTAIVWYAGQPTGDREGDIWTFRFRGWCRRASAVSLCPANGTLIAAISGMPTVGITTANLALTGVSFYPNESPDKVDVEFAFRYNNMPTGAWLGHYDGEIEQRAETTVRDVPVRVAYECGIEELEKAAQAAALAGQDTIPVPGIKYYYTIFKVSFSWSESNLITASGISIARVGPPTGLSPTPTENHWILQGKSIENVGAGMSKISEEWEYSPVAWNIIIAPEPDPEP
jgi:hypothetical protein